MTFVVPVVLVALALVVVGGMTVMSARRNRLRASARVPGTGAVSVLVHSINDDRCTGCDACVAVCPTNVLDLVDNKSRVLRFQDCIQCEACMWACPTTALVMHREGTEPPSYRMPDLDAFYQTRVPGQYLIGEVAGKPLVKNAANLGRAVVEHMRQSGLRPIGKRARSESGAQATYDVAIVGSGPGGLSAALTCRQRGLSYVLFEKDNLVASTIARYPKGKLIMAEPYDAVNLSLLPVFDSSKEEMVPLWKEVVARVGLDIKMNEVVERVVPSGDGWFDVVSNVGSCRAQRVVIATGLRGKPRTLGVPGENLPKVSSLLEDPDQHRGQTVCVVGGGDSALEAAIALADAGARVILSYRGPSFSRAQPKNRKTIESYEAQRRLKVAYQSEVVAFDADTVALRMGDGGQKRYPNQAAFVLIGADPPIAWLATMGIHFVERPHLFALPKSDDLVRQLAGADVQPCPDTAEAAAALVLGQELPEQPGQRRPRPPAAVHESRPRKWLRSASGIITGSRKLEAPMELGEFARSSRRHSGRGRRDQLEPRERTRVLRMLRDEGGRRADEDSQLHRIRDLGDETSTEMSLSLSGALASPSRAPAIPSERGGRSKRRSEAPPPLPVEQAGARGKGRVSPGARVLPPHAVATQLASDPIDRGKAPDPVPTLPPQLSRRPSEATMMASKPRPPAAAPAATTAAKSDRGGRSRPPVAEEATEQLDAQRARNLLARALADQHASKASSKGRSHKQGERPRPSSDDDATREMGFAAAEELIQQAELRHGRGASPPAHDDTARTVIGHPENAPDWDPE